MPLSSTFRDPAGSVQIEENRVLRQVRPAYAAETREFLASPIALRLIHERRLIASKILEAGPGNPVETLFIEHPRISFPSYPWEWPPALLHRAAEFTLSLCGELIPQGWILKDATPLNILFRGSNPVFVDLLSITRRDPTSPLWLAYAQFVRTFLLPLYAKRELGWPLSGMLQRRDGYDPVDLYKFLPWHKRLSQPARSLITAPVLLDRKWKATDTSTLMQRSMDPEIATHVLQRMLSRLRGLLTGCRPTHAVSTWSTYVESCAHYSIDAAAEKLRFVDSVLLQHHPTRVLDIGCNTGTFSALAARHGSEVVAIDSDISALDRAAEISIAEKLNILTLAVDLDRPTPAAGWDNSETLSFLERAAGHFDLVMMLAVIHHLLLQAQVPLDRIASLAHSLTRRHLLVEWVPQTDPMWQQILRGRDSIYAHLTEEAFLNAFSPGFLFISCKRLSNGRSLHLLERR